MKTKHAGHIRYGIQIARMSLDEQSGPLSSWLLPRLTIRAYVREDINVLRRMLRCDWISTAELRDKVLDPMTEQGGGGPHEREALQGN